MQKIFSKQEHEQALLRRRIKFVVEKGAMARLFRQKRGSALQKRLFSTLKPKKIGSFQSRADYDRWLIRLIEKTQWRKFSREPVNAVCWAHFAKLVNIVIYEIASNRELLTNAKWKRVQRFLHVPIDNNVLALIRRFDSKQPKLARLKGMKKTTYLEIQDRARRLARENHVPPIWFEAAYSPKYQISVARR